MSDNQNQQIFELTHVQLNNDQLKELFPYHILVKRDRSIIQLGAKLRELCPDIRLGQRINHVFKITSTNEQHTFKEIFDGHEETFYLEKAAQKLILKGSFCVTMNPDVFLFTGHVTHERLFEDRRMLSYNIAQAGLKYDVDPQGFARYVHEQVKRFCDAENFHLTLYEKELNRLNTIYLHDSFYPLNTYYIRKFDKGLSEYVIESGETLLIKRSELKDFIGQTDYKPMGGISEVWLMVPMKGPNGVKGVITIESIKSEDAFSEHDQLLMEFVATQVLQVLEKHEAFKMIEDMAKLPAESPSPILRINLEDEIIYSNKSADRIIDDISREKKLTFPELLKTVWEAKVDGEAKKTDVKLGDNHFSFYVTPIEEYDYVNIYALDVTDRKQVLETLEKEKAQVLKYQSQLLSSQLNPHFIFNTLNSLQYYIFNQDLEPGLNFIADFSKLIRKVLENSEKEYITIQEEIQFLEQFLKLAQSRDPNKFDYSIKLDDSAKDEQFLVPPMLFQPFVENAIIHGVGPLKSGGQIDIQFTVNGGTVTCTIEDNGVGFAKAEELKQVRSGNKKSLGTTINNRRLEILNSLSDDGYNASVRELKDGRTILGTRVTIDFPLMIEDE